MKLAHISDSHYDQAGRLEDVIKVHQAFVDLASYYEADLILHTGDMFERRSTPLERQAVAEFLAAAAEVAPVVVVKGNHDAAEDLALFGRLRSVNPITVFERPNDEIFGGFRVSAIPWFDRAHLVSQLEATADQETTRRLTITAAEQLLLTVSASAEDARKAGQIPILAGHLLVQGSETSTGQVMQGTTVEISPHALIETGAEYIALGHIHKTQTWYDGRVAYAGSPHRTNFGEPEDKGFRLVRFLEGRMVENAFVPLPARRIVLLEEDWTTRTPMVFTSRDVCTDALVRFRYRVAPENLHLVNEAEIETALQIAGAAEVQIEAVLEHQARVRSEEIVKATSVFDKVRAYWASKGVQVDDATAERVQTKLGEIEGQEAKVAA